MTTYWTMGADEDFPEVTLCEEHALEATNMVTQVLNMGTYATMAQAAVELEAMTAIFGNGKHPGFDFRTSEEGWCEECHHQAAREAASEESA